VRLEDHIQDIPDFPKPGIVFKDITPLFLDGEALAYTVDLLAAWAREWRVDYVVSAEARGAVLGLNITFASLGWLGATVLGGYVLAVAGFGGLGNAQDAAVGAGRGGVEEARRRLIAATTARRHQQRRVHFAQLLIVVSVVRSHYQVFHGTSARGTALQLVGPAGPASLRAPAHHPPKSRENGGPARPESRWSHPTIQSFTSSEGFPAASVER